jgi:hypothetical protein
MATYVIPLRYPISLSWLVSCSPVGQLYKFPLPRVNTTIICRITSLFSLPLKLLLQIALIKSGSECAFIQKSFDVASLCHFPPSVSPLENVAVEVSTFLLTQHNSNQLPQVRPWTQFVANRIFVLRYRAYLHVQIVRRSTSIHLPPDLVA